MRRCRTRDDATACLPVALRPLRLTAPQRAVPQPTTVIHYSLAMPDRSWTKDLLIVVVGIVLPIIFLLILAWHYLL